jgi:hypothetical protein
MLGLLFGDLCITLRPQLGVFAGRFIKGGVRYTL